MISLLKKLIIIFIVLIIPIKSNADEPKILISSDGIRFNKINVSLSDNSENTKKKYNAGSELFIQIQTSTDGGLYIEWLDIPTEVDVFIDGKEYDMKKYYNTVIPIQANTNEVKFVFAEDTSICKLCWYEKGNEPEGYHEWEERGKLDYLIIATHPDDDVLFLGAVAPILEDQGYHGTSITTCTNKLRRRIGESLNGSWTMGIRIEPLFAGFNDYVSKNNKFKQSDLTLYYVRALRQYKPEVVITQDTNGEYGHWQHKIVSAAVEEAVKLCNDPNYDQESVRLFGTWQVKKLYKHLETLNKTVLNVDKPLMSYNRRTALNIAKDAFKCHNTQQRGKHKVTNESKYSLSDFGMTWGIVDSGESFFDNIPATKCARILYAAEMLCLSAKS